MAAVWGWLDEQVALAVFALSFVGLNVMHMGATWSRVYLRRAGWQPFPIERVMVPAVLVLFALTLEAVGGGALLLAAQYFLSFHHALMQNYGIVRVSQRRTGRSVDVRLDFAAGLLLPAAALLHRSNAVCGEYSGALLPVIPDWFVALLAVLGGLSLLAFLVREWRAERAGVAVNRLGVGVFAGTNLVWSALLVGISHPAIPLYALASCHYVQYLFFVRQVERRDSAPGPEDGFSGRLRQQLQGSSARFLLALLLLGGGVVLGLTFISAGMRELADSTGLRPADSLALPAWAAAMIGVNLEHYWLDHRIWRNSPRRTHRCSPPASTPVVGTI